FFAYGIEILDADRLALEAHAAFANQFADNRRAFTQHRSSRNGIGVRARSASSDALPPVSAERPAISLTMHPPQSHPATLLKIYSAVAIGRRAGGRSAVQEPKVRMTLSWREMDSNFRYRGTKAVDFRSIPGIAGVSTELLNDTT